MLKILKDYLGRHYLAMTFADFIVVLTLLQFVFIHKKRPSLESPLNLILICVLSFMLLKTVLDIHGLLTYKKERKRK
jgi:hypothetical protein